MALFGLAAFTPQNLAAQAPKGLDLAETEIAAVITILSTEIAALEKNKFEVNGHVAKGSFGHADRSPLLDTHHARAHGVVTDTLKDLLSDLQGFQVAVTEAKKLIGKTDEEAEENLRLILTRTNDIDMGSGAYNQAQHNNVDTTATEEPEAGAPGAEGPTGDGAPGGGPNAGLPTDGEPTTEEEGH